jgi:uncharacterized membrane protein
MTSFRGRYSTGSTSTKRAVVGFLVAPLISSALVVSGVLAIPLIGGLEDGGSLSFSEFILGLPLMVGVGTIVIGAPLTYLGMLLIGVPTWLALRRTQNESGVTYALIGGVGGALLAPLLGGQKWEDFPMWAAGAVGGASALFFFWRIARERGPKGPAEAGARPILS